MAVLDTVIRGGRVLDGTGTLMTELDVGIADGRIAALGHRLGSARVALDATDLVVAPGFIDMHTHTDFTIPLRPAAEAKVLQGVTTDVTGNCGFSPFPLDESDAGRAHGAFFEPELHQRWPSLSAYAAELTDRRPAINVAPLIGMGAIRLAVLGDDPRTPDQHEVDCMRTLLADALRQGAFGASSGLVYDPGCHAATAELIAVAEPLGRLGGIYATHLRNEADELESAVAEALEIGRRAGCPVHISHHKAIGRRNWGTVERTLAQVDSAVAAGLDVTLDAYPYVAGSSTLVSLIPTGLQRGGIDAIRGRLADPTARSALADGVRSAPTFAFEDIVLAAVPSQPDLNGLRLCDVAERLEVEPTELVLSLIERNGLDVVMTAFGMNDADVCRVLSHSRAMVGSDGWVLCGEAPGHPHPRNFSFTARFLTSYVRDRHIVELERAVRMLSTLPADRLGLGDRGRLVPGAVADIVAFDYEGLLDRATYEQPRLTPEGVVHVLVAGEPVVQAGEITGARPGRVLRRMP